MENLASPRIECVDTMDGGVLVEFDDGKCALYSASLLRATLDQAVVFDDEDPESDPQS
jgi:hypothetical protein